VTAKFTSQKVIEAGDSLKFTTLAKIPASHASGANHIPNPNIAAKLRPTGGYHALMPSHI
jgi:hypothetical protein